MIVLFQKKQRFILILAIILFWQASPSYSLGAESSNVHLRILETTDLHASLVNYNYYLGKADNKIGLVKTASLIKQARKEVNNSLLFDVGDHLQGNPLGGYMAWVKGIPKGYTHPVYRAFNYLDYDCITIGNHEFNYGLEFLNKSLKGTKMPVVNANVVNAATKKPFLKPYVILKRSLADAQGNRHNLRIGVIGVMPPQIMYWDKQKLEGKLNARPIVETITKYIPIMKRKGADIIIALAHTGISSEPYDQGTENAAYYLTKIADIDAILTGHSHNVFPSTSFKSLPNTDLKQGTINGKPVVMAGAFGNRLGIIDVTLQHIGGKWKVINSFASTRPIAAENGTPLVKKDPALFKLIKTEHYETIDYMKKLGL